MAGCLPASSARLRIAHQLAALATVIPRRRDDSKKKLLVQRLELFIGRETSINNSELVNSISLMPILRNVRRPQKATCSIQHLINRINLMQLYNISEAQIMQEIDVMIRRPFFGGLISADTEIDT